MQEISGWRINNIEEANIVILKQRTVEKVDNNYESHIHLLSAIIQSKKKI